MVKSNLLCLAVLRRIHYAVSAVFDCEHIVKILRRVSAESDRIRAETPVRQLYTGMGFYAGNFPYFYDVVDYRAFGVA